MASATPPLDPGAPLAIRLDARQQRIVERLSDLVGPGAATFFRDAVQLMNDPRPLATVTHLVSHLLRETQGMILDVLAPPSKQPKPFTKTAPPKDVAASSVEDDPDEGLEYPKRVRFVLTRLEIGLKDQAAQSWLRITDRRLEKGLHRRAHRAHLDDVSPLDDDFRALWAEVQFVFDAILDAYETKFPQMLKEMSELVNARPSRAGATRLRSRTPNTPLVRDEFFLHAGPEWMLSLRKEGLFDQPIASSDDKLYRWSQSSYLKRMAALPSVQPQVAEILAQLEPVPLLRAHLDLLEAAEALPASLAAGWVEKEARWVGEQYSLLGYFCEKLAGLAAQLATAGACVSALRLARALVDLRPGRSRPGGFSRLVAAPLFDHHYYTRIVGVLAPLRERCAWDVFLMGVEILAPAIEPSVRDDNGVEDYSRSWCERIGEISEHDDKIAATLVRLIRDAARTCASADPSTFPLICARLRKAQRAIFRRIELDLLAWYLSPSPTYIAQVLMERDLFARSTTWPEYSVVLTRGWEGLDGAQRAAVLSWVAKGPEQS